MAHIQRYDFFKNILYELVLLPVSFHPAAILMKRRIDETRELICDELATRSMIRPADYARSLVNIARSLPMDGIENRGYSMGVCDANILEVRIMRLLHVNPVSHSLARIYFVASLFLLVTSCVAASSFSVHVNEKNPTVAAAQKTGPTAKPSSTPTSEQEKVALVVNTIRLINTAEYRYGYAHGGKSGPFADFATLANSGMLAATGRRPFFGKTLDKLDLKSDTEPLSGFALSLIVSADKQSYSLSFKEKGGGLIPIEFFSDQGGVISRGHPIQ